MKTGNNGILLLPPALAWLWSDSNPRRKRVLRSASPTEAPRLLSMGPSTLLLKAAIESFVPSFMYNPVVLVVTESRRRLAYEDATQLRRVGMVPDPRVMPDLVVADVGVPNGKLRVALIECVATGGAMTRERVTALHGWLEDNGLGEAEIVFGSVFSDHAGSTFRRLVGELAWGTFVWFASEPSNLLVMLEGGSFDPRNTLDAMARTDLRRASRADTT